ncbi:BQ5605_C022g09494 [Microbotryum silenes-dioicae]|uniref:BQ5605_C022g09494 protein n=1 Tax=Microbotryum silenes-dioicae TaxID=796604 RepID=A0A2X0MKT0_9BASI|nr:BQ5605_C022g09494 [Microbotryum silenes-dioicae]
MTTRATGTLAEVRGSRPGRNELRHATLGVIALLLALGRINDVYDVRDRDRSFGDVGRDDDASYTLGSGLEHKLLIRDGDRRVQDVHFVPVRIVKVDAEQRVTTRFREDRLHVLDLIPTGQEDEHVTFLGLGEHVRDHECDQGERHVEVVDLADGATGVRVCRKSRHELSCEILYDRLFIEDPSSFLRGQSKRPQFFDNRIETMFFHGEASSRYLDDRRQSSRSLIGKVRRKQLGVDRSRHQHDADLVLAGLSTLMEQHAEHKEQQIGIDVSFMDFVNADVRDTVEEAMATCVVQIGLHASEEKSCRAEKDRTIRFGRLGLEADLVTDRITNSLAAFLGDTFGDRDGSNSTRLRAHDVALGAIATQDPVVQDQLGYLRRLSGTGGGQDDSDGRSGYLGEYGRSMRPDG